MHYIYILHESRAKSRILGHLFLNLVLHEVSKGPIVTRAIEVEQIGYSISLQSLTI